MSTLVEISSKGLFKKNTVSFDCLINEFKFKFGSYDDQNNLQDGKMYSKGQCVLYNPNKPGLGIFLDGSFMEKGQVKVLLQFPTIPSEIKDFLKIIKFITKHYVKYNLFLNKEKIDLEILLSLEDQLVQTSLKSLNFACKKTVDSLQSLRLALFSIPITEEDRDKFSYCLDLSEYEKFIIQKQKNSITN